MVNKEPDVPFVILPKLKVEFDNEPVVCVNGVPFSITCIVKGTGEA